MFGILKEDTVNQLLSKINIHQFKTISHENFKQQPNQYKIKRNEWLYLEF